VKNAADQEAPITRLDMMDSDKKNLSITPQILREVL